ncbi:MAG: fatty acid desaturase [Planctomycetes bacterium]|nr:fatty acid desaturase [Planctomycetota bacterium]
MSPTTLVPASGTRGTRAHAPRRRRRRRSAVPSKPRHRAGQQPQRDDVPSTETDEARASARTAEADAAAEKAEVLESFDKGQLRFGNIDWVCLVWVTVMHAGAIAAPFFFSWSALGIAVLLHWLTCSIGVCLGYHRYLTHRALKLTAPGEFFCLLCATLSGQGSPRDWTATHRLHHQHSDLEGDPHSPREGTWWSHILWLFIRHSPRQRELLYKRYAPELIDRPIVRFFEKTEFWWQVALGLTLLALGGLPWLLWGLCLRIVFAYHSTWFVNSATHLWGYRNYETRDGSKNLWWVALFAYGEGWHNNHHAHPSVAPAGHRWWEIDMTWWAIRALKLLGVAYDVNDRVPPHSKAADESPSAVAANDAAAKAA